MKLNTKEVVIIVLMLALFNACKGKSENISQEENAAHEEELPLIAEGEVLKLVADDYEFTEGPAVDAQGNVFFTDQPNNRIMKWDAEKDTVSVYLQPAGRSNGLYFDNNGNLLACADEKFELWQIDANKNITILLDNYKDKKLNGPNDLWIDNKGGIYFTDPYYQRPYWTRTLPEMESKNVYYLTPDRSELKVVAENLVQPNGIIGSPDGKMIYISDIGDTKIYSYRINDDTSLSNKTLFVEEKSDGLTLDNKGHLYITNDKGVTAFNTKGKQVLNIPINQSWTANVTFGGKEQNILFITAMTSVYTLKMNVKGVR
ncbi:SMP-30/gluconolactonase/LRE family protein [Confluentibacter citreus]|uniref:SMP-30/gluconolactonase/LRE family protein n=1 Tax=Confluentibacter citreus TaxID=2007307 RepID=UPI001EFEE15E|nr:SMP-30/gluconolactonase/LRE family protein [Confluentibacter citreus]